MAYKTKDDHIAELKNEIGKKDLQILIEKNNMSQVISALFGSDISISVGGVIEKITEHKVLLGEFRSRDQRNTEWVRGLISDKVS